MGQVAVGGKSPGRVVAATSQFNNHFLTGLVFHRLQHLLDARKRGAELVFGQCRLSDDIAVNLHCDGEVPRQCGSRKGEVRAAYAFMTLHAEVIESGRELLGIPLAGATGDEVTQHGRRSVLTGRIVNAARGNHQREGRRLNKGHLLDDEGEAIRERVRLDVLILHHIPFAAVPDRQML